MEDEGGFILLSDYLLRSAWLQAYTGSPFSGTHFTPPWGLTIAIQAIVILTMSYQHTLSTVSGINWITRKDKINSFGLLTNLLWCLYLKNLSRKGNLSFSFWIVPWMRPNSRAANGTFFKPKKATKRTPRRISSNGPKPKNIRAPESSFRWGHQLVPQPDKQ